MRHYKLFKYSLGGYEREIASGTDESMIAEHAISLSSFDEPYMYAYRLEAWVDDNHVGGWRFFQNGREFTQDILNTIKKDEINETL